jgi:hypothetical protein
MVTCFLTYTINPEKIIDFEEYGRIWIRLVEKFGGTHHGYFLPSEGACDIAYALFSFSSLAKYEEYRHASANDDECKNAIEFARKSGCIIRYDRTFMRPLLKNL